MIPNYTIPDRMIWTGNEAGGAPTFFAYADGHYELTAPWYRASTFRNATELQKALDYAIKGGGYIPDGWQPRHPIVVQLELKILEEGNAKHLRQLAEEVKSRLSSQEIAALKRFG